MARYIDADALKLDIDMSQGASITDLALSVIRAVQNAPTADVVPKGDWLEALALIEQYEKTIDNGVEVCNGCHAKYDEKIRTAKAEVTREIFAEIDKNFILIPIYDIDFKELKKKYTGATDINDGCKIEGD